MATRLRKTLTDYLVIAISPSLIMTLIGSLTFFLLEVFYRGQYQGRLQYVFALFIMGATLIGRISIEEGRERAVLFAIPLGLVTLLAVHRFVTFQDPVLASWSFLINLGILTLVGWSADKLVWDCTLIDETEEDSGAGLLETVGLDRSDAGSLQAETTTMEPEPASSILPDRHAAGWWDRFVERRRRPHPPGVWVVYFSLAAVALFGVGQLFIPADNLPLRRYAFQLLCVDTASSLGLLLTTSFLGLRRSLRQRRQAMPAAMARRWLFLGVWLIVGVMAVAMVVPRPDPEYAVSELPQQVRAPVQKSSRHGMGREPAQEQNPRSRPTPSQEASESQEKKSTSEQSGKEKQETSAKNDSTSKKSQADDRSPSSDRTQPDNPMKRWRIPPWLESLRGLVSAAVVKWIVYLALAIAALGSVWTHRHSLAAALRQFWQELLGFWSRWFGGRQKSSDDSEKDAAAVRRSFADFADPFATGLADRWSPAELVRYSFEALEAWAADHGCPRPSDQTPHEFARLLSTQFPKTLTEDVSRLADWYCQAAYAQNAMPKAETTCMARLWQQWTASR
ncbi:MAG: DUF4129 domain-containing protein [Thermoguttaceae bacterium]